MKLSAERAAQALMQLVASDNPPLRLYLGDDALQLVEQKLEQMKSEIAAWESVSRSTGFALAAEVR